MAFPLPVLTQTVFVNKSGNDSTGNGSLSSPYLTIAAALASITDATTSKRYVVNVSAGLYAETSFALKPFVWIEGAGQSQAGACRVTVTGNYVTLAAAFSTGNNRAGIQNIYFSGSTGINIDLVSLASSGSNVFEFSNIGMNGEFLFKANNAADFVDIVTGRIFGNILLQGGNVFFEQVYSAGGAIVANTSGPVALSCDFLACSIAGNSSIYSSSGRTNNFRFIACAIDGTIQADQVTTTVSILGGGNASYPTITNGATVLSPVLYLPLTPANWAGSPPTTLNQAVDRLASANPGA